MNIKKKLDAYLDSYLKVEKKGIFAKAAACGSMMMDYECADINTYIDSNKEDDTFQTYLFRLIDERNLKDSDVYNKVNVDRRLFSKIRSNEDYHPSKETIIALGLSLELNIDELLELLESASYSLPKNNKYDLIIRFCFQEHIYNIDTVNEFLYDYGYNTL